MMLRAPRAPHEQRPRGRGLLADWLDEQSRFIKVIPRDYKRVLLAEARARSENREPVFAELVGAANG